MAITLIGTRQIDGAGNGGDVTLTFDGTPLEDDVVILLGGYSATQTGDPIGATGYSDIAVEEWTADEDIAIGVWYKVMGATPDTTVVGLGSGHVQRATVYASYMFRGVDTTTVEDAAETQTAGSGNDPDHGAIVTATDGAVVFAFHALENKNTTASAAPTGYTGFATVGIIDTIRYSLSVAYKEVASASSEDPGAYDHNGIAAWKGFTVAVRPSVAAPAGAFPPFQRRDLVTGRM